MKQVSSQIGPFSIVPEWVLMKNLSPTALKLYCVLGRFADYKTGMAFPSRDTLAERMQCSGKTVDRAVTELVVNGCIEKVSRGRYQSALYRVLQIDPNGTDLSEEWTELSDEGTDLSERGDKNDTITITTKQESKEQELINIRFDQFWAIYPLKKDKPSGRRAFKSALKRASFETILDGAQRYRDDPNREDGYTKNPSTWLNNDAWENGPEVARRKLTNNERNMALLAEMQKTEQNERKMIDSHPHDFGGFLRGIDD